MRKGNKEGTSEDVIPETSHNRSGKIINCLSIIKTQTKRKQKEKNIRKRHYDIFQKLSIGHAQFYDLFPNSWEDSTRLRKFQCGLPPKNDGPCHNGLEWTVYPRKYSGGFSHGLRFVFFVIELFHGKKSLQDPKRGKGS